MNYKFHVGDYVETAGGAIGYVSDACHMWWQCVLPADGYNSNNDYSIIGLDDDTVYKHFSRIGAYDFTKKEKKKIEQLEKNLPVEGKFQDKVVNVEQYLDDHYYTLIYSGKMIDKINELVDAVNKLMDKEDEE